MPPLQDQDHESNEGSLLELVDGERPQMAPSAASVAAAAAAQLTPNTTTTTTTTTNSTSKVFIGEGQVLRFERVSRHDMGFYMCIASNGVPPSVSQRIFLPVSCK